MNYVVLLADNDPEFLRTRSALLSGAGYEVKSAATRERARQVLEDTAVDVAVLDVRLEDDEDPSDSSGIQLASDRAFRHIPKIMLTGFVMSFEAMRDALGFNKEDELRAVVAFVGKDEPPEKLLQVVRATLEGYWDCGRQPRAGQGGVKSILFVDDKQDSLTTLVELLKGRTTARVVPRRQPTAAFKLAHQEFFDMIVIDAYMDYGGTKSGGLDLYNGLRGRYGSSSLVAYSRVIRDDLLKRYDCDFNLIERRDDSVGFVDRLVGRMTALRRTQTCFVAMPFESKYDKIFRVIEQSIRDSDYKCVRVDKQDFTNEIVEQIFQEIRNAKLLVFLATDRNANAFYECGYAVAMNKEIVTITDVHSNLPFDIQGRNAIAYGGDLVRLRSQLTDRLLNLTVIRAAGD